MIVIRKCKLFSFNSTCPDTINLGNGIIMKKVKDGRFFTWLGKYIKAIREVQETTLDYEIYYKSKEIGLFSAKEESRDEVNFMWINIYEEFEGKGYAQAVLNYFINAVKKEKKYKRITLEVPGFSPNAKHIEGKHSCSNKCKTYL